MQTVQAWEEDIFLPTYPAGEAEKNPMFFEKRVYQGSSGVVYPHPIIESIGDKKEDRLYHALFLENQYLKIMILPELGGRVQMAYDKIANRHFIYYNRVIKPALVGLCGPWISGGIEFNWPQHHRPSTFEPVDFMIRENEDGSKTVIINEVERMFRTKGMASFTLYPANAYLEIKAKLYNRTSIPQTFLWWANPAVKVNDDYQSVFPPDVNAVFDHGKRDVSSFPIATGIYYKVDYAPGTDISRYKNIPVPTSYMAINSAFDFVGGYEHDTAAGVLHVANHHISPGKKQWTWGHGDFGRAWDDNLTDEDGPYIELMTGVFTDNQPDFSWLMPYEEKSFTQYFLPYRKLGMVKNASKDLLLHLSVEDQEIILKLFATSVQSNINVQLFCKATLLSDEWVSLTPENIYERKVQVQKNIQEKDLLLLVKNDQGTELIRYEPAAIHQPDFPEPAKPALSPELTETNEQLFFTAQHLEQYRHANFDAASYYLEALKRDATDSRCNNALGLLYFRRGQFVLAEEYFRQAVKSNTRRNPNPYDSEAYYNLGLCLRQNGYPAEAHTSFYKATWSSAWQAESYFQLAQLDMLKGQLETAIEHLDKSIDRNANNGKAYTLKAACCRLLRQPGKALHVCHVALERDVFNLGVHLEQVNIFRQSGDEQTAKNADITFKKLARGYVQNYLEYALDFMAAGLFDAAIGLLKDYADQATEVYPMALYYIAWAFKQKGDLTESGKYLQLAATANPDYCFPNRLEDIAILEMAIDQNPEDYRAPYFLGNLWYDKRQYENAMSQWWVSLRRNDQFPTVWRNLGMAYFNKQQNAAKALAFYKKAFELNKMDGRVFMELDQLQKRLNIGPDLRLQVLEEQTEIVLKRDDLYLEKLAIYNFLGNPEKAYELLMQRRFHPWEGGEGKVTEQYVISLVAQAKQLLTKGNVRDAIDLLNKSKVYPRQLGEGKLHGAQENDIDYWLGKAYRVSGEEAQASLYFQKATVGLSQPSAAIFYNDQQPDKIFYQGLAWKALEEPARAETIFRNLIDYAEAHLDDKVRIDYFAVSLPNLLVFEDDLDLRNFVHCRYMMALGFMGAGETALAKKYFEEVLQHDAMHFGAGIHLRDLEKEL